MLQSPARVWPCALSPDSTLHTLKAPGDFLDCYAVRSGQSLREAAETITTFPGWVQGLMRLRNLLVQPFGLLPEGSEDGPRIGPFPITSETEDEIIAGFDDRHLNFRVSIRAKDGVVTLATWVRPHHLGDGRTWR